MKKRGFGTGKWNGFGGKIRDGESAEDAVRREVEEEIGVTPHHLEHAGTLEFVYRHTNKMHHVHVFRTESCNGEPQESDEMRPQWFSADKIPFDQMWADDKFWLPLFFEKKRFEGKFIFDDDVTIAEYELKEI